MKMIIIIVYYYKLSNVVTDYNEDVHGITFNINASS